MSVANGRSIFSSLFRRAKSRLRSSLASSLLMLQQTVFATSEACSRRIASRSVSITTMDVFKLDLTMSWATNVKCLVTNKERATLWKCASQPTRKEYAHMLGVPDRKRASLARCCSSDDIRKWIVVNSPMADYRKHPTLRSFTDQLVKETAHSDVNPQTLSRLQHEFWANGGC